MKLTTKIGFISLCIGILLLLSALIMTGFDYYKFDTRGDLIAHTEEIENTNQDITIHTSYAQIKVESADTNEIRIVSDTFGAMPTIVHSDSENSLYIEHITSMSQFIGITVRAETFTLVVPIAYTGNIKIESNAGNIDYLVESANDVHITNQFGNIYLANTNAQNIAIHNEAGNIKTDQIQCNTFVADTSAGNIDIHKIQSSSITLKTNLGNIDCLVVGKKSDYNNTNGDSKYIKATTNLGEIDTRFSE